MWKLIGKPKVVEVTQKLAQKYATMDGCPNDRVMSESRMKHLRKIFESGQFRTCEWATACCLEDGNTYRVNGKHTSNVLAAMTPFPEDVSVIMTDYEVVDLEELAKLYSTFDPKESSKNSRDINWLVAGVSPEFKDIPKNVINLAVTALAFDKWEMASWNKTSLERASCILDDIKFVHFLAEIMIGDCRHIRRGPVVSAMVRTFRKSQNDSKNFWEAVREENGELPTAPDRKLAKWLNRIRINMGANSRKTTSVEVVTFHEAVVRCIQFFNAWRKGEKVEKMPPYITKNNKIPAVI